MHRKASEYRDKVAQEVKRKLLMKWGHPDVEPVVIPPLAPRARDEALRLVQEARHKIARLKDDTEHPPKTDLVELLGYRRRSEGVPLSKNSLFNPGPSNMPKKGA